jgi:acetyl-CoA acetyltransferase
MTSGSVLGGIHDGSFRARGQYCESESGEQPESSGLFVTHDITSENVAERYGVGRKQQDAASVTSHQRAAAATENGKFKQEIVPVHTKLVDPKTGEEKQVTIAVDDGIRPQATLAELATSRLSRKVAPPQQAIHPRSVMAWEPCCS